MITAAHFLLLSVTSISHPVPSAAPEFTITAITATSFTVSWQPLPACEKNGVITGYTISVTKEGMPFTSQSVTPNVLSMNFSSLTPFVTYGVRMSASSVIGQGMLSPEVTIRTNESGTECSLQMVLVWQSLWACLYKKHTYSNSINHLYQSLCKS